MIIAALVITVALHAFILLILGASFGYRMCQAEAVESSAAHYVLDENNERQFRWGPKTP